MAYERSNMGRLWQSPHALQGGFINVSNACIQLNYSFVGKG